MDNIFVRKKNILITGGAGLIGSRFAKWVLENSFSHVAVVDNFSGGYTENIPEGATTYNADVENAEEIERIFQIEKPDVVYHLAAYAAEGLSPFIRCFNYRNNLEATANIVNMCIKHNVAKLVFTSSMAVYGMPQPGKQFDEDDTPCPIDPYGVAKFACEMDIQIAGHQHGLDWCIIRPHNVFGAHQNIWDRYRNVLGIWMYQHLNGQPLTIFGDGTQSRSFSPISDILEPLWNAQFEKASKQIINLGSPVQYTIKDAAKVLITVMGSGEVVFLEPRHEVKIAHPTWQKSVDLLGYAYTTSLDKELEEMWQWAQQQPNRPRFTWPSYELDTGIYSFWK